VCPMQSQSQLEENILIAFNKIVSHDLISGMAVKENRVLLSLKGQTLDLETIKAELTGALKLIRGDLELSLFSTGETERDTPQIRYVIAVASGKGGVGKSTVAVNLAFAFSQMGLKVGLLDADVYGPSIPHMLGLENQPQSLDGKKMMPEMYEGVACMSMGLLIPKDQPAIWRGPMIIKALNQMLEQVDWGHLDIMVIDMPPGTGDAQLTISQKANLAGAIIVSTPQDLALIDARKGLKMFQTMGIPILGIVENMSSFACPHCGKNTPIFHHGGASDTALQAAIPFLGEIPLYLGLREAGDAFKPFVLQETEHEISKRFMQIANQVWTSLHEDVTLK
jgi:ATP-binding protein involved in chromosome partitioning